MGRLLRSGVVSLDAPACLAEQLFFLKKMQTGEIAMCKQCHALFACKASCGRERGGRTTVAALLVALNEDKGCHLCVFPSCASA